jgi:hypothetical protein
MTAKSIISPGPNTSWANLKRRGRKTFRWFAFVLLIVLAAFTYWKYFFTYSEGYRAGLLQKFSHKGTIFKTYEGEMILSSVTSSNEIALASEKFLFSVTDQALANQLDTIQGLKVMVHYKQRNGVLFWRGDTKYSVDRVKLIPQ